MALISKENKITEGSLKYASCECITEPSISLSGDNARRSPSNYSFSQKNVKMYKHNANKLSLTRSRGVMIMVVCLYLTMSSFGTMSALGVVYVELISAFDCLRSEAALVQSLYMGIMLGGGILFAKFVTKYDTGACVMTASVLAGTACACGSLATNIGTVIALVGVMLGLFTSVNVLAAYIIVNWTFVGNRKFALGILTFGSSIGQTVFPYITNSLIESYSWNGCLLMLSALAFLNGLPCGLVIHFSGKYFQKAEKRNIRRGDESFKSFLTDSAFMVWIFASFIFTLLAPVEQWFVVDVAVLKGFGTQSGATLLSLNGIFGFVGRITTTIILRFYPNTRPELHICYGFALLAVGHIVVVTSPVYLGMLLAMVLRGFSMSVIIAFTPSLQLELRGPEQFPKTVAIDNMIMGIADIIGGYLGGFSADVTGSYNLIF